ncbi:hypothetical protein FKM82_023432 [Ascaphus truei]
MWICSTCESRRESGREQRKEGKWENRGEEATKTTKRTNVDSKPCHILSMLTQTVAATWRPGSLPAYPSHLRASQNLSTQQVYTSLIYFLNLRLHNSVIFKNIWQCDHCPPARGKYTEPTGAQVCQCVLQEFGSIAMFCVS